MTLRTLVAVTLAAASLTGCKGASTRWSSSSATARDPERWERAACRRGEYPNELDARAMAWAHFEDVRAGQSGSPTIAVARLERERVAFDARCSSWRTAMVNDGI